MQANLHEKIVIAHAQSLSLEEILQTALRDIYQQENLPDNPFPTLSKTVKYYKIQQIKLQNLKPCSQNRNSVQDSKLRVQNEFMRNETVEEGLFKITSVMGLYNVYGIKNVLEILHPQSVTTLYEVHHAISGGYLFRNNIFDVPEVGTTPLRIYSIYQPTVINQTIGINFFIDYLFDDVLQMSRVDQEFNLFKNFSISGRDLKTGQKIKKNYTLEEVINGKNSFYTELRDGIENKYKIALKLWMRIKNLSKIQGGQGGAMYQSQYGTVSGVQNMVVNEDEFIYVQTEKVYILHLIENRQTAKAQFSFSHSPLCALMDGVFQTKEAAIMYASFYISQDQDPAEKSRLQIYLEDKYFTIFEKFQKNNLGHCIYETLLTVMLESEKVRKQIVDGIMMILAMPVCRLYGLVSVVQVLQKLLQAYYDYKFPQFRKSLENQFNQFYNKLQEILAVGFSAETIVFRKYLDILVNAISGEAHKELEIDGTTMETFRNIETIIKCISLSQLSNIATTQNITKMTIDMVSKKYGAFINQIYLTPDQFLQKKGIDRAAKLEKEREKNKQSKMYPNGDQDLHILCQYTVDTFISESLYYILRDQFMNPQYPNSLALASLKLQSHLIRFDIYGGITDDFIRSNEIFKPYQNPNPPYNLYILGTTDMREKQIPFAISDYYTLSVCSALDMGLFKKFYTRYEVGKLNVAEFLEGGNLKVLSSVVGYSIFNKFQRLKKQTSFWSLMYDIVMVGSSFEASIPSYIALILKYATFLHKETDAVFMGFYTDTDPENAAVTIFQIRNDGDLKEASRKMYEFVKGRIRLYMRLLLPIESNFKKVHISFNMHFKMDETQKQYSTLYPVNSLNDVSKVFFVIEDFEEWNMILKSHALYSPTDHLIEEYKNAYLDFRFMDAFKCLILLKVLDERFDQLYHFLRLLYSQAESFTYHLYDISIIRDLVKELQRCEIHRLVVRKVKVDKLQVFFKSVQTQIENEIYDHHLTVIESYQSKIVNQLREVEQLIITAALPTTLPTRLIKLLETMAKKLKTVELQIKFMSNCLMLYASEFMKSSYNINVFDDPLTIE